MKIVLAVAFVALLAACDLSPDRFTGESPQPTTNPKVLAIGDSNLAWAGPQVIAAWSPKYDIVVDAKPGAKTYDDEFATWSSWIPTDVATVQPTKVLVQLGTNDATVPQFQAGIERILSMIPASTPVYWTDVRIITMVDVIKNVVLNQARVSHPNLTVLLYDEHFNRTSWVLAPPNVHLTNSGRAEYARWTLEVTQ